MLTHNFTENTRKITPFSYFQDKEELLDFMTDEDNLAIPDKIRKQIFVKKQIIRYKSSEAFVIEICIYISHEEGRW